MAGAFGGVAAMAVKGPTPEEVAAWVEETTRRQGVPLKVEEPGAVDAVVTLLREGRVPVRAAKSDRGGKGRSDSDLERPG